MSIDAIQYLAVSPEEQTSQRCKQNAEDEESWKHRLCGQDRLPCLQTLLLERGVYQQKDKKVEMSVQSSVDVQEVPFLPWLKLSSEHSVIVMDMSFVCFPGHTWWPVLWWFIHHGGRCRMKGAVDVVVVSEKRKGEKKGRWM